MEVKILMESSIKAGNFNFVTPEIQKELQLAADFKQLTLEKLSENSSPYRNSLIKIKSSLNEDKHLKLLQTADENLTTIDGSDVKIQVQAAFEKMTTIKFFFPPMSSKNLEASEPFRQILIMVEQGNIQARVS